MAKALEGVGIPRVAGVGAGGDGSDEDRAVAERVLLALVHEGDGRRQLVARDGEALRVKFSFGK